MEENPSQRNVRGMENDASQRYAGGLLLCCLLEGRKQEIPTEKSSGSCAPLANILGEVHQAIEPDNFTLSYPTVNFAELLCLLELEQDGKWKIYEIS